MMPYGKVLARTFNFDNAPTKCCEMEFHWTKDKVKSFRKNQSFSLKDMIPIQKE